MKITFLELFAGTKSIANFLFKVISVHVFTFKPNVLEICINIEIGIVIIDEI
jgi:hypothetical protein